MPNGNRTIGNAKCRGSRFRPARTSGCRIESCEPRLLLSAAPTVSLSAVDVNAAGNTPVIIYAAYTDANPGGITGISGAASARASSERSCSRA